MSLTPWGMKTGRDAIIKLLSHIWSPQNTLKVFHVTGSNGKGSVCQMFSQILHKQFKKKVGLFTSPHLIDITERFQINGAPIPRSKLNKYYKKVLWLTKKYSIELSFFEIQVVTMVLYFSDEKVDYAIVEVWLGGLYDGTNIFEHPLACFITSITPEHTHLLGKTRKSVQRNKLGIVKSWTTLYTHIQNKQIREYCDKKGVHLIQPIKSPTHQITNLPGQHQQKNALLVLQALMDLWYPRWNILEGLKSIYNPGRFELFLPHILLDTANNEESIRLFRKTMKRDFSDAVLIFGTTQIDPKYVARLTHIFPDHAKILVDGFCERALPCSQYCHLIPYNTIWHLDTDKWKNLLKNILKSVPNSKKYIIFWSLYLVGYVMGLSRYNIFAKH